jgi:hypothetical protein
LVSKGQEGDKLTKDNNLLVSKGNDFQNKNNNNGYNSVNSRRSSASH